ncbi:hypothetical protein A9Q84_10060 [Halobacteriovorax marinus]|uniref:L,D-TPase catalytic domain-containing protein n=1 Tax=Halobacteriovorax marinus TaxID=97084 RepID=A0A1Y5F709_9BACT|nr:hypothetical protein A9Q84_10060 [Halobacteriovorax marinus]
MNKSLLVLAMTGALASGCGAKKELYPNTGSEAYEKMVGAMTSVDEVIVDKNYFTTVALSVRDASGKRLGLLSRHDKVTVVSLAGISSRENYVQVTFRKRAYHRINQSEKYYVSFKYLSERIEDYKDFDGKYFVIQNLATERLRVYEKNCNEANVCLNKMIMETEMAVGEDTKETRSIVGSFRITDWWKFYQDHAGHYPSWYRDSYPAPPKPGSSFLKWFKNKYMPKINGKRKGDMRGAFGWYTAWVGPNHLSQWTHGTVGWGQDKDKLIKATKKTFTNLFADPRSSGCSRLNNEAVAYLREILPVGTPIVKIYAKEALLQKDRANYTEKTNDWSYILTTNNAYSTTNFSAGKDGIVEREVPMSKWIEQGTFRMDSYPTMYNFTDGEDLSSRRAKTRTTGNIYRVDAKKMKGVFYVDAGLIEGYSHPKSEKIAKGGFRRELAPAYMLMSDKLDKSQAVYTTSDDNDEDKDYGDTVTTTRVETEGRAYLNKKEDRAYTSDIKNIFVTGKKVERETSPAVRIQLSSGVLAEFQLVAVDKKDWKLVVSNETLESDNSKLQSFVKRYFKKKTSAKVKVSVRGKTLRLKKTRGRNIEVIFQL